MIEILIYSVFDEIKNLVKTGFNIYGDANNPNNESLIAPDT